MPSWWTRATLERARSCLTCDVIQLDGVPTMIDMALGGGIREALDHFVIEPEGGEARDIALASARRHFEYRPYGGLVAATNGHDIGIVVAASADGFVFVGTTADGRRITHATPLSLPADETGRPDRWDQAAIAASPDRFAVAIGHSAGAVWFEFDLHGDLVAGPVRLRGLGGTHPQVVWTGERFALLAERRAGEGFGAQPMPAVWLVNAAEPSVDRVVELPRDADDRRWIVSGEFLYEHDAMFFAAKGWSVRSGDRFELFRVGRDRTLASRECEDIDEE